MVDHTLHAIVTGREHEMLEAQLVELKIVVGGATTQELLDAIGHAIEAHFEHARQSGMTPFADLFRDESGFGFPGLYEEMGPVHLRKEVSDALAIALRAPKPFGVHVKSVRLVHAA